MSRAHERERRTGPPVACDDCGRSLGRLVDGRGIHVPDDDGITGRYLCEWCHADHDIRIGWPALEERR